MERRSFLKLSCGLGAGILLSSLGVSVLPIEAFAQELTKYDRIKTAKQSTSICCYCAVGVGFVQHRYEDRQDHQYRRRPRTSHQ